ncbi:MAG: flavodoxin family protein [Firmicutes bacterium]|nr:flavodoxin family protein [Bacillota bacterium]
MEEKSIPVWDASKPKKIYVINGSPQRNASGTMRVTNAFLKGIENNCECETQIDTLSDMNVKMCYGCLSCWGRTDGTCIIDDDIVKIKQRILDSDVIIASFPLYFFGMPGSVKNMTDRLLSTMLPYRGERPVAGLPYHEFRYDFSEKKFLLISTCGFGQTLPTYNALLAQYDCIFGRGGYQVLLCPQGKVFSTPELSARVDIYLEKYTAAGKEFAENGVISDETIKFLQEPIFDERRFHLLIDEFWRNEREIGAKQHIDKAKN